MSLPLETRRIGIDLVLMVTLFSSGVADNFNALLFGPSQKAL